MNSKFIDNCQKYQLTYNKKEGTKNSFALVTGRPGILPKTLCLGIFAQGKKSSRDKDKINEINGMYNLSEEGIYKHLNKRKVHSNIWTYQGFPEFYGYGIIDERFNIFDLVILHSEDNCTSTFTIHIYKGLGKPDYMQEVFKYLRAFYKTQKSL